MTVPFPRILVVDDEPNVLITVQAILREEGYEVDACPSGDQAIRVIQQRSYDLVLTDLKMAGADGLAVLAEVRKRSPQTVTVMMTGYGSVASAIEAVQLGAYEYLLKPVEVPELKAAVRRALERKRLSEIDALYGVGQLLSSSLDRTEISREVCNAVRKVLSLERAELITFDRNGTVLLCAEHASDRLRWLGDAVREQTAMRQLSQRVMITRDNATESLRGWADDNVQSFALVPGVAAERLVCVLYADNGHIPFDFHASATRFLYALAAQAASTLENASLVAELKKNNLEIAAANQKLRELDRLKSQFLAVATHELRTPLTIILGYNSMLAESLHERLTGEERQTLDESTGACRRLISLVNSMLDISQIESGKMRMSFARTDLQEIITGVVALFHYEANKRGVVLSADVPGNFPVVVVDPGRVQQILTNLVANALKFTDAGGTVKVSARLCEDERFELSVSDNGLGIDPEYHESIFDEFAQIPRHTARRLRDGSGLGLAIVKRIVKAHQGEIRLQSQLGLGSTFSVKLPLNGTGAVVGTAMTA